MRGRWLHEDQSNLISSRKAQMQRPRARTELCMFQGPAKKASGLESKQEGNREGESGTPT